MTEITRTERHTGQECEIQAPVMPSFGAMLLIERHDWLRGLAERIVGPITRDRYGWRDELAGAVRDTTEHAAAMDAYEARDPAPDDDAAYDRWLAHGPQLSPRGRAFAVMSSGETRIVRLLATLSADRIDWSVADVTGLDHRGARIVADWLQIVRAQLPEWLYEDTSPFQPRVGDRQ